MSEEAKPKSPTHGIYHVTGEGEKKYWRKVGVAWMHKDGKGASLRLDMIPFSGDLVLREFQEREPDSGGQQ